MESLFNALFALMAMAGIGCLVCNFFYTLKKPSLGVANENSSQKASVSAHHEKPTNLLASPKGEKDDLKRIKGVGPKLENSLNALGVFHFSQIAAWSERELEWIDDYLSFKGRAKRDNWIAQAKALSV